MGHSYWVLQRSDDSVVPINTNAAQMENGRGRKVHIQRVPHVTHKISKEPLSCELNTSVESHRTQCYQHICHSQADNVIIRDDSKLSVSVDTDDHQSVAENCADDYGAEDEGLEDEKK